MSARWPLRLSHLVCKLAAVVCCATVGLGQERTGQSIPSNQAVDREAEAKTILGRNDANGDGLVSKDEAQSVVKQVFDRIDLNRDGHLDLEEIKRSGLRIRSASPRSATGFAAYDANSDGLLSRSEAANYWTRLIEYDMNKDDALDQQEYAQALATLADRGRESLRRAFAKADTNSDGELTREEFDAAERPIFPPALFARSDADSNNALDKTELESAFARIRFGLLPPKQSRGGGSDQQQGGQIADSDFDPKIERPAFAEGQGPVVLIDEAHGNFHTAEGRYAPFAKMLRRDGYVVRANSEKFTREGLAGAGVLVISNALAEQNQGNWRLPTPSAFTREEIDEIVKWVSDGGSLLLIADHMPFAGAAQELGSAFDVRFLNGFALPKEPGTVMRFDRASGQLHDHAVTRGRDDREHVDSVATFTGSAFQVGPRFQPLLQFGPDVRSIQPEVAWQFSDETPRENVQGWCQAAVGRYGKGRVAIFGEAAMFSAQRSGADGRPFGMNAPEAAQNGQLLLNTLHWLTGLLENR